jgi:hypothetical protein
VTYLSIRANVEEAAHTARAARHNSRASSSMHAQAACEVTHPERVGLVAGPLVQREQLPRHTTVVLIGGGVEGRVARPVHSLEEL